MSCFLVSDNHLSAICSFAGTLKARGYSIPDHGELFVTFKKANLLALKDRYGDVAGTPLPKVKKVCVPALAVVKACQCLEYQCSDWNGWDESNAKRYLGVIFSAAVMEIPGYEEAAWAIA